MNVNDRIEDLEMLLKTEVPSMNSFTIHIETNNAVFDDSPNFALAGLLHKLADHIEAGELVKTMQEENGNTVLETFVDIDGDDCCRLGGLRFE